MDAADRALLAETVANALAGASGGGDVDGVLARLGWLDMLDAEPAAAIDVVFGALGATNANATALDDVLASGLAVQPRADLAVLLPPFTTWDPPGRVSGGRVRARGLATARAATADDMLIVCDDHVLVVPTAGARVSAVLGIDPGMALHVVEIDRSSAPATSLDRDAWDAAVAYAQRALAHQLCGASRTMLQLARTHALARVQFDRPIARFQAVRHRLAEALVAVEALEATLGAAADTPNPQTAQLAKAVAGRTARVVAAHCQQVLAGIGFTTDHPFHRYLKRTIALDGLFGSSDEIVRAIGAGLLAARSVPTLIEL